MATPAKAVNVDRQEVEFQAREACNALFINGLEQVSAVTALPSGVTLPGPQDKDLPAVGNMPNHVLPVVVLGPGATIFGVATKVIDAVADLGPLLGLDHSTDTAAKDLARAIWSFNAPRLAGIAEGTVAPVSGIHLSLPFLFDATPTASGLELRADKAALDALAAAFGGLDGVLYLPWLPLEPDDELTRVGLKGAGGGTAVSRARILTNPFAEVFTVCQWLRESSNPTALANGLADGLSPRAMEMLAKTTGGQAILRQLVYWGGKRPSLVDALKLGSAPEEAVAGIDGAELPLVDDPRVKDRAVMVLGRLIKVGQLGTYKSQSSAKVWEGWAVAGSKKAAKFVEEHEAALTVALGAGGEVSVDKMRERLKLVAAISSTEGNLDAARLMDAGVVSGGIQQWSAPFPPELPVLLERFRLQAPDLFDILFTGCGRLTTRPLTGTAPAGQPSNKYFPKEAGLYSLKAGSPLGNALKKEEMIDFFGGVQTNNKTSFKPFWCGLMRLAALCSDDYCLVQVHSAAWRLNRILNDLPATVKVYGANWTVPELFNSAFGAALLVDHHINSPGGVRESIDKAIAQTKIGPGGIDDLWRVRFTVNYFGVRKLDGSIRAPRNDTMLRLHESPDAAQGFLSLTPGSFHGW